MSKAEEFIQEHTRICNNQYDLPEYFENGIERLKEYQPWLSPDQARKAVEIARKETLLEVAAWINDTFIFSKQTKEDFSQTFNIKLL